MICAFVGMGSNLEDPISQIKRGIEAMRGLPETELIAASSLYRTPPWGKQDQPDFINAVVKLKTKQTALHLMSLLFGIENAHHRTREEKWGPRTLDCDLILYGQHVIETPELTVPHPRMKTRGFVLLPLAEIAPNMQLPTGEYITDLLAHCDCIGIQKL